MQKTNGGTALVLISSSSTAANDIRYLSGFGAPDAFVYVQTAKMNYLVVAPMEKRCAARHAYPGTIVLAPHDLGLEGRERGLFAEQIAAVARHGEIAELQVPADFPIGLFHALEKKGLKLSVKKGGVCPQRRIKSRDEIRYLRMSQHAAVAAMDNAIKLIGSARITADGALFEGGERLTSEHVRRTIQKTLIEMDCCGSKIIVAGGDQAIDPHEGGHGPLWAGQAIVIDIFPRHEKSGYWGDLTRTVCRGPAAMELKKLYHAVYAAQAFALNLVKAGMCGDEIHQQVVSVFKKRGYENRVADGYHEGFIHGTGHGVGLDIHESPRIGKSGEVLQPGDVVTVEPGLYYLGLGGVRIEDVVVVEEHGCRLLAHCPKKFEWL